MTKNRLVRLVGITLVSVWIIGCDGAGKNAPAVVKVKGTVTLDGNPMPDGEVMFSIPSSGTAPSVMNVVNGAFSGEAKVGENRVEVYAYKDGPPSTTDPMTPTKVNFIPDRYGSQSTLTAAVTKDGPNEFKFEVKSK